MGDDGTETDEEVEEGWGEDKLEGRLRGLQGEKLQWGGEMEWGGRGEMGRGEMEWGGRGEARGVGRERLPRSESSSPHKLHPARSDILNVGPYLVVLIVGTYLTLPLKYRSKSNESSSPHKLHPARWEPFNVGPCCSHCWT